MEPDLPDPGHAELLRLHHALCAGDDPTVPARMAELVLPALLRRFRNASGADPHSVESLVGLSIARYLSQPERYHPDRSPLLAYLWRDVEGDRINELSSRSSLRAHEVADSDAIEVARPDRNPGVEEEVLDSLDPHDVPQELLRAADIELQGFDAQDHALLMLMVDGVRETTAYAQVLGISHLPMAAQRKAVKRHKDRLKKRLEGIRGRLGRSS